MGRCLSYLIIVSSFIAGVCFSAAKPEWVSDQNIFLKNFVNHELLNLLGVILAITLASIANIHLEFNKIEEKNGKSFLKKSRENLKKASYWLILLFVFAIVVVFVKPISSGSLVSQGIFNAISITILIWHILILVSIVDLVFAIGPNLENVESSSNSPLGDK